MVQVVCDLKHLERELCDKLEHAKHVFKVLQDSHDNHLHCHDRDANANRRVQQDLSASDTQLCKSQSKLKMLENMLESTAGLPTDSILHQLQSDWELLIKERIIALEYTSMLQQLDLPCFVNCF
ncbi:hypothetical protein BDP27DRAFT_1430612 [Rhodocollybia butyracea]|uniref:Uncharacterized protein n=1 Tax=Rhodocollybia butyracea TaxID=206335 RepID=A0A9P5TY00_9AGAR|nr:hypothetical protein BDP27DRAFT_1430612 [Rhodocollybia butyracea]